MNPQNRDQASAQEAAPPTMTGSEAAPPTMKGSEAAPPTGRYAPISDNGRAKFKEPQSWALNWCGFSLGCLLSAFGDRDELGAVGESPTSQTGR